MAFTELLTIGQTTASSTRTIAAGATERVGIKGPAGIQAGGSIDVEIQDDALGWHSYRELRAGNLSELFDGPLTYRVVLNSGNVGAYVES